MDLSLTRITSLLAALPQYTRPTIHIAGTNGKGSVTAILDSILRQAGYTTGRFNSPHLVAVHDSIRIDGAPIPRATYDRFHTLVAQADERCGAVASSFELLTATALCVFEDAHVDVVILEVGLGGRLDATNAVPLETVIACGITAIDLDHQAILGDTVQAIAGEKAGIMRGGTAPCFLSRQIHPEVLSIVEEMAKQKGAELVLVSDRCVVANGEGGRDMDTFDPLGTERVSSPDALDHTKLPSTPSQSVIITIQDRSSVRTQLPLLGAHQLDNAAMAITIIDHLKLPSKVPPFASRITNQQIVDGVRNTRWAGRVQWLSYPLAPTTTSSNDPPARTRTIPLLVDGAHNTASATALSAYLSTLPLSPAPSPPRYFILSLSHSPPPKTPLSTLAPLLRHGDAVAVVPFSPVEGMPWVTPVDQDALAEAVGQLVGSELEGGLGGRVTKFPSLAAALKSYSFAAQNAKEHAENEKHLPPFIVVTGSLYLVADAFRLMNIPV